MTHTGIPSFSLPPVRSQLAAADRDQARELMERAYGWRLLMTGRTGTGAGLAVTHVGCGAFEVADVTMPGGLTFQADGHEAVVIGTIVDGRLQVDHGRLTRRYQPGDVFIANSPHCHVTVRTHDNRNQGIVLAQDLLTAVAGGEGRSSGIPRFTAPHPVSSAAAARWQQATGFVDSLLAGPGAASPLVIGAAARLLAATALTVFPNTAVTGADPAARRDARPATVRRAVSFIEAHADQDITIADIAAAAHVTTRAVQLAFKRHLHTTPMAFLRQVRLSHAHHQLQVADPSRETVTAVAYRWGFSSPSRFTAYYRDAYGITPTETLKD
ncbi:MAG TPA: helix-turn-helix domain-containing protein [Trebonia sp.]|nr:helix-turn-helix domain-containing protein [Trebonia sp.]